MATTSTPQADWPTRRLLVFSLGRIMLAIVLVLAAYAVIPDSPNTALGNWLVIIGGLCIFVAVLWWQVTAVTRAPRPVLRAIEAMGICVTLFLTLFASQYLAESLTGGSSFSEPLSKFTSLYYTVTVFSTVGFGDITPVSNLARALTMCQMFGNLIVLGIGVRVLTSVAQESLEKKRHSGGGPAVPAA